MSCALFEAITDWKRILDEPRDSDNNRRVDTVQPNCCVLFQQQDIILEKSGEKTA